MSGEEPDRAGRSWLDKFHDAFGGIRDGARGQTSFTVHIVTAAAVVIVATNGTSKLVVGRSPDPD